MTRATRKKAQLLMMLALCAAGGDPRAAVAADFELTPSLSVSEEYNDNIFETESGEQSEFITRVRPGAAALYRTSSSRADLRYTFDYRNYARGSRGDEKAHTLAFRGNAAVTENFLFLELSDTLRRVSLDLARDVTSDSLFANQTDQNVAVVSPYLLWRPGGKSMLRTGYRYTDTRYWGVDGFASGIDQKEHSAFADLNWLPALRLSLSAGYAYSSVDTDLVDYDEHILFGAARYEYALNSFLYAGIGNNWQSFSGSRSANNLFWHAGVTHDAATLVTTLEARVQFTEDPLTVSTRETSYSARIERPLTRGNLGFSGSYARFENTLTGQQDRKRTAFSGFGRYELTQRLSATVTATGDRVRRSGGETYPYHFSGNATLSRLFNHDVTGSLSYSRVEYRRRWDSSGGARQTNRVILEVSKLWQ